MFVANLATKNIFCLDAKSKLLHKNMSGAYRMCIKPYRTSRLTFDTSFTKIVGNGFIVKYFKLKFGACDVNKGLILKLKKNFTRLYVDPKDTFGVNCIKIGSVV